MRGYNKGQFQGYQDGFDMACNSFTSEATRNEKEKREKRKLAIQKATHLRVIKREHEG